MIRSCCFGVALVILAAFNVAAEEQGITQTSPLRAAVVKVDITPRDSKWLSGYQARQSDGVLDNIHHRVLALEAGGTPLYLIASDLCRGQERRFHPGADLHPTGTGPFPVVFYIHGGGWVIANLDTYDASARAIANAAQAVVVSTHYRQGREHKLPTAHEDVYASYKWTLANAKSFNADRAHVARWTPRPTASTPRLHR